MNPKFKKPRRKTRKAVNLSPGMKSAIKKVVAPAEEVKYVAEQWDTVTISPSLNTSGGTDLHYMIPEVAQGAAASERIGNTLNPKGVRTHFQFYFANDTLMTANVFIRLLCVSSREIKDYANAAALIGGNLFLNGDGAGQDINGASYNDNLVKNQFLPINRKSWIVHHDKTIHLAKGYGFINNDTTSLRVSTGSVPVSHRCTLTTPHKGAFKYDNTADTAPNNFAPFWCAYIWTSDGGNTTAVVKCDTRSDLYFTE